MAIEYAPLFALETQFQSKDGRNNTGGWLKVFLAATDDPATTYSDYNGTRNPERIVLDDDGRAVVICDKSKAYRLEVYGIDGALLWTEEPVYCSGTGGGGVSITKVVSTDGSISVDKNVAGSTTTYDLSLGIDTDDLKPSCLKASSNPLTADGQFVFTEIAHEGTLLSVDNGGKVRMEPAWYHFTATVELAYDGTPANEGRRVTLWSPLSSSVTDFDTSYAHSESIELSGDIRVDVANTEFPLGVSGIGDGIRASLVGFDIHVVTGHGGNNDYHAGEGIVIVNATRTISADFGSVQEKLVAGDNISISGNVISAGNISQEQASWTEEDTESPAYIRNKPDLDVFSTKTEVNAGLAAKQDTIPDLAAIRSGAQAGASAVQSADLAAVATTGDYNSLNNRPNLDQYATDQELTAGLAAKQDTIPDLAAIRSGAQLGSTSVQPADLNSYATDAELTAGLSTKQDTINDLSTIRSGAAAGATALQPSDVAEVAVSGDYADLINKPTIPTKTSDLTNDSGFITVSGAPVQDVQVDGTSVVNAQGIAEITMPTTGVLDVEVDGTSVVNAHGTAEIDLSGYATTQALDAGLAAKQDVISDLSTIRSGAALGSTSVQPGDLAAVATSGSYDELVNKPEIPDSTSDLTNDSGFITSADVPVKGVEVDGASVVNAQGVAEITMPDLSGYATTQALDTGLAVKQDVISDLAAIRSGAAAGATAVQPADLDTYATDAELAAGLSTKQDVIDDLSTIRSGAAAGATAVQPADLAAVATSGNYNDLNQKPTIPSGAQLVPAATSADADKVLTVDSQGIPAWIESQATSEGLLIARYGITTYDEVDTAARAGKIVYCYINGRYAFLAYTNRSGDDRNYEFQYYKSNGFGSGTDSIYVYKVRRAGSKYGPAWETTIRDVNAGNISYPVTGVNVNGSSAMSGTVANITVPTVDQTYDATSANAQSGVAVAGALATVSQVPSVTSSDNNKTLVSTYNNGVGSYAWASTPPANAVILDFDSTWSDFHTPYSAGRKDIYYKYTNPFPPFYSGAELYLHLTAVSYVDGSTGNTFALFEGAWQASGVDGVEYTIRCKFRYSGSPLVSFTTLTADQYYSSSSNNAQSGVAVREAISAVNQVPASTVSDADKVLTVDSTGAPVWATAQAPGSAGNGIDITDNVVSVDTSVVATQTDLAAKQDVISDLAAIRSGAALGSTAVQPGSLATVATTGSYTSLSNTPSIPAATSDLTNDSGFITLSDVPAQVNADWNAVSGAAEILNKPSIPNATSDLTNDSGFITLSDVPAQVNADWNSSSGASEILNKPTIPSATSDLTNDSGFITLSDVPAQVNADWNSSSGASEILNKPTIPSGAQLVPAATSADADKVLTVDAQGTPAWASAQAPISAGNGIDITNNVVSAKVDGTTVTFNASGELQAAAAVTVDQTYNAASTNAQSGTAVAQAVATKEDAFDVGTGLEMDTSGVTPTLQVEAPVDIVAGPGIRIDNPDGNTLRVSQAVNYEVTLFETTTPTTGTVAPITLSESIYNFEKIKIVGRLNGNASVGAPMEWEWYTNDIPVGSLLNCFGVPLNDVTNPSLGVYIRNSVEVVSNGTSLTHEHTHSWQLQGNSLMAQSTDVWGQLRYFRVIGIHRIAGGN